jgi:hypothetical protein
MKFFRVCLVMSVFAFLLLKPQNVGINLINYSPDDFNYLAHATAIAYGQFPSYKREANRFTPTAHPLGSSVIAAPFVFGFSLIDRLTGNEITKARTEKLLYSSWTAFGYVIATQFVLMFGLLMVYLTLRDEMKFPAPALATALGALSIGLPIYALARPICSHVYEFTVLAAGIRFLMATINGAGWTRERKPFVVMTTVVCASIFLIRYNDVGLSFALAAALLWAHREKHGWDNRDLAKTAAIVFAILVLVPVAVYLFTRWQPKPEVLWRETDWQTEQLKSKLFNLRPFQYYLSRLVYVLLWWDWGLIFTAPLVLMGLAGMRFLGEYRRYAYFLALPLLVNIVMILSWGSNGSFYGYRYFVYAALPIAMLGLASWWEKGAGPRPMRTAFVFILSFFSISLMMVFRSAPPFDILPGKTAWIASRVNNNYARNVLSTLVFDPLFFVKTVAEAGPMALFRSSNATIWVKEGLIVAAPLVFGLLWIAWERRKPRVFTQP